MQTLQVKFQNIHQNFVKFFHILILVYVLMSIHDWLPWKEPEYQTHMFICKVPTAQWTYPLHQNKIFICNKRFFAGYELQEDNTKGIDINFLCQLSSLHVSASLYVCTL